MTSRPLTRTGSRAEGAPPLHGPLPDPVRSRTVLPPEVLNPPTFVHIDPQEPEPSRVIPGHFLFGQPANQPDDSLRIVDDMTQVITDHLQQAATEPDPTTGPDVTAMGSRALTTNPRVITAEAAQRMIVAIGAGLKALQSSLSKEIAITRQTGNLVHAQGMQQGTDMHNGFKRIGADTALIAANTQKTQEQMHVQSGTLTTLDTALGRAFKNINNDTEGIRKSVEAIQKEMRSPADEKGLNDSLKAINEVLNSQRIKLDTIEELLQVVEERGSQTSREEYEGPSTEKGWEEPQQRPATPRREAHTTIPLGAPQAESTTQGPNRRHASFRGRTLSERSISPPPERRGVTPPKKPSIPKEARARRPDRFNGKRGKEAEAFMTKMEAHFADYDDFEIDDARKIRNTLTNMAEGKADKWAQPLLTKFIRGEKHEFFQSWQVFRRAFLDSFSDPVKKEKAVRALSSLRQTNSAQDYATNFRTLALEVNWNEEALVDRFKEGLKPEVRKELTRMAIYSGTNTDSWTLDNWVVFTGKADDMVFTANRNTHKKENNHQGQSSHMSADRGRAATVSKPPPPAIVRIPDEEKKRRRDNGLCLKCAKPGHVIKNCKGKWTLEPNTNTGTVKGKAAVTLEEYSSELENE